MRFLSALVATTVVSHTSAFLVPLEVSRAAEAASADLASLFSQGGISVDLDCPGCPFASGKQEIEWQHEVENQIHLNFNADPKDGLLVNGQPAIPSDLIHSASHRLTARQIELNTGIVSQPLPLGYVLERLEPITNPEEKDKKITRYLFTITALDGIPIQVDTLAIGLLESPNTYAVAKVSNIPFEATPGAQTCHISSSWSLCRVQALINAHINRVMAAGRAQGQAAKNWIKGGCRGRQGQLRRFGGHRGGRFGGHAHDGRPHHHRGHHFRTRRVVHVLYQTLRFLVIPAMLGVIGGLMASAVGMLVGQFIAYLWIRFRRGGQRGTIRIIEVPVAIDEKDAMIVEEHDLPPPPQYYDVEASSVPLEKQDST